METHEQTDAFSFELDNLVDRFLAEFDIGVHTIVGVMEDKKLDLLMGKDIILEPDPEEDTEEGDDYEFL